MPSPDPKAHLHMSTMFRKLLPSKKIKENWMTDYTVQGILTTTDKMETERMGTRLADLWCCFTRDNCFVPVNHSTHTTPAHRSSTPVQAVNSRKKPLSVPPNHYKQPLHFSVCPLKLMCSLGNKGIFPAFIFPRVKQFSLWEMQWAGCSPLPVYVMAYLWNVLFSDLLELQCWITRCIKANG